MCSCSPHHRASPRQHRGDVRRALRMSARWTEMLDSEAVWPRNQGNGGAPLLGGDPWRLPSYQQPRGPVVSRLCVRAPLRSCRGAGGPSPGSSAPPTLKARVLVLTLLPPPPPGPIHPAPLLPRTSEHLTWTPLPTYVNVLGLWGQVTTHLVAWDNTDLSTPRSGGQKPGGEPPALHLPELFLLPELGLGEHLTVPSSAQLSQLREGSSAGIFQPLPEMGAAETPGPPCSLRRKPPSSAQQCLCPPGVPSPPRAGSRLVGSGEGHVGSPAWTKALGRKVLPMFRKQRPSPKEIQRQDCLPRAPESPQPGWEERAHGGGGEGSAPFLQEPGWARQACWVDRESNIRPSPSLS